MNSLRRDCAIQNKNSIENPAETILPLLLMGYFGQHILEWVAVIEDTWRIRAALIQSTQLFSQKVKFWESLWWWVFLGKRGLWERKHIIFWFVISPLFSLAIISLKLQWLQGLKHTYLLSKKKTGKKPKFSNSEAKLCKMLCIFYKHYKFTT